MAPSQRRRSIDSSSDSSESPHQPDKYTNPLQGPDGGSGDAQTSSSNNPMRGYLEPPPSYTPSASSTLQQQHQEKLPPSQIPPSGYRIALNTPPGGPPFPGIDKTRAAPLTDADGKTPVFIGSALMQDSVHPCKIVPNHPQPCYVSYGGAELTHQGRYDLLPVVPEHMEFVRTSHGRVPSGRRPVKGGFENNGAELYHAVAEIEGVKVPGKTGTHLNGCNVPFGGMEHVVTENYEILCWKF